jgi:hypothetical protein
MNKEPSKNNENHEKDEKENARVGYQVAVDLTIKEEKLFWDQFNALLVANSILIIAISSVICRDCSYQKDLISDLPWFLATIGVVLCVLWYLLTVRRDKYRLYYLFSAREIEAEYLGCQVQTIRRGKDFSDGSPVLFKSESRDGEHKYGEPFQLPLCGRMKVSCWAIFVIGSFSVIYLFILYRCFENIKVFCLIIAILFSLLVIVSLKCWQKGRKIELDEAIFEKLTRIKDKMCLGTYTATIESLISFYSKQKESGQKESETTKREDSGERDQ